MCKPLWTVALCAASLGLGPTPARALDAHTALAAYGFQSWQTDSGLPQNTVHAIVQGRDGFLWIATEGGLVRFDGAAFAVMTHADTPGLPSDLIDGLMEDRAGTLWISTSGGLARMRAGRIETVGGATQVWRTFEDASGTVWALTASGLFRAAGERLERVPLEADLTENSTMAQGASGELWLGTQQGLLHAASDGIFHSADAGAEVTALATDATGRAWAAMGKSVAMCAAGGDCHTIALPQSAGAPHALASDAQGHMWVGTDAGLYSVAGEIKRVGSPVRIDFLWRDREGTIWAGTAQGLMRVAPDGSMELLPGGDMFLSAMEDREGDLWLGTEAGGLQVLRDRKFSTLTAADGLSDEYVLALAQAPNGHVGVGTRGGGLNVYRDGQFRALTTAQGLASNVVLAVAAAANGDVWAGTPDGLDLLHEGQVARAFTTADGLADDFVRSLFVDHRGDLWIGTRHGLSQYANGKFTTWSALDGLGSDLVGALAEDAQSHLWIGTLGGLTELRDGRFRNFTTKDGLSSNVVTSLHADGDGTLWIGTNDAGLNRMRAGKIVALRVPALPQRVIGILEDAQGYLWLSSNSGVYRVRREELNRVADDPAAPPPDVMRFGVADGMRISECSSGGHPAALQLQDGELWFATLKGIARVDPAHMPVNRVAPQIAIERVSVDDEAQRGIAALTVTPGHSHYEFDYAGLSFVAPQKVEYRYELEGFDPGWVEAGTRRVAYYTNLPHGHYTFRVIARNNDGVWSAAAATAELTVEPHYYQTPWFRLLAALAFVGLGYAVWRRRLLGVERQFQAVLGERTRIAREIHDTLAQGFVAVSVQLELIAQLMHSSAAAAREQLEHTRSMVRSSLEDARLSIWELRSQTADREDLPARLLKMAEEVTARAGSPARTQMQVAGANHPLEAEVEREVARIAREAVVNAVRHGHPENILLRLEYDDGRFRMEIRDDGRGFAGKPADGASGHYGLTGMRERASAINGTLSVESGAGAGTRVRLELPLRATSKAGAATTAEDEEPS
ncbi:MAG TPA: two-component regulator propeller domain-containing protein [Acidobacteriaceae bacterium]|jgi:signal transduction histidine kinase/ligand-binding sensor domain-containing protein|nr:two-component regulator propeller domain-containing protein [Acidobacteriaceae bacterium]